MTRVPLDCRGVPMTIGELARQGELPDSQLDLDSERSFNNHHLWFTRRAFGQTALLQCLRDISSFQELAPRDVHQAFHNRFAPPKVPRAKVVANFIMEEYDKGIERSIFNLETRQYEKSPIPNNIIDTISREYSSYE